MGDGELRFLLEMQQSSWRDGAYDKERGASCEEARGTLGLSSKDFSRLLASYENADIVDLYTSQPFNRNHLDELSWNRAETGWTISSPALSGVINEWTAEELCCCLETHRVLIAGAEVPLLKELLKDRGFRRLTAQHIPWQCKPGFYSPPEHGRNPSRNLERIKAELAQLITKDGYDTMLLSLGGPAKILCYELARETGVRAIDWGSMLRGLTYSGSDGYASWRSSHNPYFFRVPFKLYMEGVERAWPDLSARELLGKAHAQLCLELQRKEVGKTFPSDVHDPRSLDNSPVNRAHFRKAYREYRAYIRSRGLRGSAPDLVKEMKRWKRKQGIGLDGIVLRAMIRAKAEIRRFTSQ